MNTALKKDISQSSDKIALLAILVVGVLFSLIVVSIKNNIRLDKPIELPFSGFSASLPAGENWNTKTPQWVFDNENNYFYIGAIDKQKGMTSTVAQWRYIVCPEGRNVSEILAKRGEEFGGYSGERKTFIGDGFGAYLADFRREIGEYVYLAIVVLEPGRAAELEVRGKDTYLAEDIFISLLNDAKFETNGLLNKGRLVAEEAFNKSVGPDTRKPLEKLYLIDSNGLLDGFSGLREVKIDNADAIKSIMFASMGVYDIYRQNFFTRGSDGRLTWKFVQKGSQSDMKKEILLEVGTDRLLTVTDFTKKTEKELLLGYSNWPEIMEFELFEALIDSDFDKCVVDMLSSRGQVLPAFIEKKRETDGTWQISMSYFHTPKFNLTIHTDDNGIILKRQLDTDVRHKMRQCSREEILARYPENSTFLQELFE